MLAVQIGERIVSTDRVPVQVLGLLEKFARKVDHTQFGVRMNLQPDFHIFLDILESVRIDDEGRIFGSFTLSKNASEFELRIVSNHNIQFLNSDGKWETLTQSREHIHAIKQKLGLV